MALLHRVLVIVTAIAISTIVVQCSKGPAKASYKGYRVACMPLDSAQKQAADKNLIPYAQIAHTSYQQQDPATPYRCYFRFAPQDIVCTPVSVATRQNIKYCAPFPMIDGSTKKQCYVLNPKLIPLTDTLKKQPAVSLESYLANPTGIVQSWQEVRDILLKSSENE